MTLEQNGTGAQGPETPEPEEFYLDDPNDPLVEGSVRVDEELMTPEEIAAEAEIIEEVAEPEATQPDEPESEPEEEVAEEVIEPEDDSEPEPEPEPEPVDEPQGGTPNKALQKLQQRQSATERQLQEINENMKKIVEGLNAPPEVKDDTPKQDAEPDDRGSTDGQSDEYEAALADLNKLIEEQQADEFDEPSRADLAKMAAAQTRLIKAMRDSAASEQSPEIIEAVRDYQERQRQRELDAGWKEFEEDQGYDGRPLWQQAVKDAIDLVGEDSPGYLETAKGFFRKALDAKQAELNDSQSVPEGETTTKVKPASSGTRKPAKGTQTTPTGAKGAGQTQSGERELRCWRPD